MVSRMLVGIDLVITNIAVALGRDGAAQLVPNALGKELTPSAVSIAKNGQTWMGEAALDRMAIAIEDGKTLWQHDLPAQVTKGGIAVDASGKIYLTLEDGQLICFAGR